MVKTGREAKIDLLAYRQEEQLQRKKTLQELLVLGLIAVILLGSGVGIWWSQKQHLNALEKQNQQIKDQVEDMTKIAAVAGGVSDEEMKELGSRKALLSRLEEERILKPEQLEDIYALSVPDITIGKMEIKEAGELTINAYTTSQSKFIAFVEELQKQKYIKDIQKITSKRNNKTGEINFTLTLAWEVESK